MTSLHAAPAVKRAFHPSSPNSSSSSKRPRQESEQAMNHTNLADAIDPALEALDSGSSLPITAPWNAYAQPSWPAGERSESAIRSTGSTVSEQQTATAVANYFVNVPFAQNQPSYSNAQLQQLYNISEQQQQQQQQQQTDQPAQQQQDQAAEQSIPLGSSPQPPPSHLDQFTIHIATSLAQTYADTLAVQSRLFDGIAALQVRLTESGPAAAMAAGVGTNLGDEECLSRLNVLSSQISKMNRRVIGSLKNLYGLPTGDAAPQGNGATALTDPQLEIPQDVLPEVLAQTTFAELEALPTASISAIPYTAPSIAKSNSKRGSPKPLKRPQNTVTPPTAPIIPAAATPQAAVVQWLSGDPAAGLSVPLKDWPPEWKRGNQIYCQRRTIYRGWEMSGKDWVLFTELYGTKVSMAAKAITQARIQSGEIKTRHRKRAGEGDTADTGEPGTED